MARLTISTFLKPNSLLGGRGLAWSLYPLVEIENDPGARRSRQSLQQKAQKARSLSRVISSIGNPRGSSSPYHNT